MIKSQSPVGATLLALALLLGGCATAAAPPAPPAPAPGASAAPATRGYVPADVAFMQGMIAHHRQALEMTELVEERTDSRATRLLAERIEVSQTDEIAQMSGWLERRGEGVPAAAEHPAGHVDHTAHGAGLMPGMLTPEEMSRLAAARGEVFDRLFLELMIKHHQGALVMVGELLGTPGAGQDVDVYRIASEVDSDQRIEIERMERMLADAG